MARGAQPSFQSSFVCFEKKKKERHLDGAAKERKSCESKERRLDRAAKERKSCESKERRLDRAAKERKSCESKERRLDRAADFSAEAKRETRQQSCGGAGRAGADEAAGSARALRSARGYREAAARLATWIGVILRDGPLRSAIENPYCGKSAPRLNSVSHPWAYHRRGRRRSGGGGGRGRAPAAAAGAAPRL
eukprot:SAG11_NODE_2760_length_3003_cov_3.626722_2_plen_193_part_00